MPDAITPAMAELQQDVYRAAQQEGFELVGRSDWTDFREVRAGSKDAEGLDLGLAGEMNVPLGADGRPVNRAPDRALGDNPSTHLLKLDVIPAMGFDGEGNIVMGYIANASVIELTKNTVVVSDDSMDHAASKELQGDRKYHEYMNDPDYRDADLVNSLQPTREAAVRTVLQKISSGGVVRLPEFAPATNRRIQRFAMVAAALVVGGLVLTALLSSDGDAPAAATPSAAPTADEGPIVAVDGGGDGKGDPDESGGDAGGDPDGEDGDTKISAADASAEVLTWTKGALGVAVGLAVDLSNDIIYSKSSVTPGRLDPAADILATMVSSDGSILSDAAFAEGYGCGTSGADLAVACLGGELPEGPLSVFAMQLAGDVTDTDLEGESIHSLVLDSDGDDANNWTPKSGFDWDFFLGTDLWFELIGDTDGGFELRGSGVTPDQQIVPVQSPVKAIVSGDVVVFFVPQATAPPGTGYRLTSFLHDGTYAPEASGGDVTGADPTQPLWNA